MDALSDKQREMLASISADIGQVSLASLALPFLIDALNVLLACLGLVTAVTFWAISNFTP